MNDATLIDQPYTLFRTKLGVCSHDAHVDDLNGSIYLESWLGAPIEGGVQIRINRALIAGGIWAREGSATAMWPHVAPQQAAVNLLIEQMGVAIARRHADERHLHVSLTGVTSSRSPMGHMLESDQRRQTCGDEAAHLELPAPRHAAVSASVDATQL